MGDQGLNQVMDESLCIIYNDGVEAFPCNAGPMNAASLGLAAGGLALIFAMHLTRKVCNDFFKRQYDLKSCCSVCHSRYCCPRGLSRQNRP